MTEKLKPIPLGVAAGVILGAGTLISGVWGDLSLPYASWDNFPWGHDVGNAVISAVVGSIGGWAFAVLYNYFYDR